MSGIFIVLAPAFIAASMTSHKNFSSDLPASSGENSTSSVKVFANSIAATAVDNTFPGVIFNFFSIWIGDVAIKVCILGNFASFNDSAAVEISLSKALARAQILEPVTTLDISCTDLKSPELAIGKPASIISTFNSSNARAIFIFSSTSIDAPGLCSPSLRVVSKIISFLSFILLGKFKLSKLN